MRVLNKNVLEKAQKKHGDLTSPVAGWRKVAEAASWGSLNDIRQTFPFTDAVEGYHVFNIKGNGYRLITTINFKSSTIFIEALITHAEYNKGDWK